MGGDRPVHDILHAFQVSSAAHSRTIDNYSFVIHCQVRCLWQ